MCTYVYINILKHKKFPKINNVISFAGKYWSSHKYHVLFSAEIPFHCQLTLILANSRRFFEIVLHHVVATGVLNFKVVVFMTFLNNYSPLYIVRLQWII